jgi:hypothetical protein
MSPLRLAFIAGLSLFTTGALAQTVGQAAEQRQETPVRVQTSFNFFVAGSTRGSEEAQKLRENARRSIYEMAARECGLLRETLAKDCKMQSITSNIASNEGRQFGAQQQDGFTVNGSMDFQITLK